MAEQKNPKDQTQLKPIGNAAEGARPTIDAGGGSSDVVNAGAAYGTGLYGQTQATAKSFQMTPKYNDPFADIAQARVARFFVSADLKKTIESVLTSGSSGSGSGSDDVLENLTNADRGYFDFLLQSVDESFDDRYQIMETLGDTYAVYGLGRKPSIFNFSGILLNTIENDWRVKFIYLYQQFASISRLAKFRDKDLKNFITLKYDSVFAQGALLGMRTAIRADNEMACPFSFSMLVTKYDFVDLSQGVDSAKVAAFARGTPTPPQTYNVKFFANNSKEGLSAGINTASAAQVVPPSNIPPAQKAKEKAKAKAPTAPTPATKPTPNDNVS